MMLRRLSNVLVVALLAGCATAPLQQEMPAVDDAARAFNNDLRWSRWQEAAKRVDPDDRGAFLRLLDDQSSPFHFTSVDELARESTAKDGTEIDVLMALEYYRLPSVRERTVRQRQHWRFDVATKEWVVTPDMSVLREAVSSGALTRPSASFR
jgi:hypothetical protein